MSLTIADYLLTRLTELGVHHMFGVPGDFNLWFLERAIKKSCIAFVGCCNELNAAYAADGCSRLSGMSALVTTYGVGELASLAGVAGAYAERVPIACITGAPPLHAIRDRAFLHHTLADGNFENMLTCYREFTVAQTRIEPSTARDEIDRVLKTCWTERRPVYLQLPSDISSISTPPITRALDLSPPSSDPGQLFRAISLMSDRLSQARCPVILLDTDAERFGLARLIMTLGEANNIPVAQLVPARGVISDSHPLSIGIYRGAGSSPTTRAAVEKSDCLVCVGTRFTDVATGLFTHQLRPQSVIDLHPFRLKMNGEYFSAVVATDLLSGLLATRHRRGPAPLRASSRSAVRSESTTNLPLSQAVLWQHIQDYLEKGDVMVVDTGTSFFESANLNLPEDVSFIAQPTWSSLGYALPAALGTCLAAPKRRHLVFLGDGAFQMTAQELSTILRLDLKPIVFLLNNDGYTIERLILGPESSYNNINPWRYSRMPEAFDTRNRAVVHLVTTEAELRAALHATRDASRLHFLELVLPRMDAAQELVRFAQRAAAFDFPHVRNECESRRILEHGNERNLMAE